MHWQSARKHSSGRFPDDDFDSSNVIGDVVAHPMSRSATHSPRRKFRPRCSPKVCKEHSGNAPVGVDLGRAFCSAPQVLAGNTGDSEEKREEAKERLLQYRDRQTGGIPGLLPLAINLPVRFADALGRAAKEQGAFKHARGILRGWELSAEEDERVKSLRDWEVVLQRRPVKLFMEVPT